MAQVPCVPPRLGKATQQAGAEAGAGSSRQGNRARAVQAPAQCDVGLLLMGCPVCPDDGYAFVTIGMDCKSPSGVSVRYSCWHGIEVEPPEWSVQAQLQRE